MADHESQAQKQNDAQDGQYAGREDTGKCTQCPAGSFVWLVGFGHIFIILSLKKSHLTGDGGIGGKQRQEGNVGEPTQWHPTDNCGVPLKYPFSLDFAHT
jgi:hypothetical protein